MAFLEDNSITRYTTPPNNYIGSTLFISYIVAALYLTATISYSLYTKYTNVFHSGSSSSPSNSKQKATEAVKNARARHIKIYTALALISFTSISWHMLSFLITSFLDWNNYLPRNIFTALSDHAPQKLKTWMLETSLFNSFAVQLVADGESAIWTQLALLATWAWNLWLAHKARQYNFTPTQILPFIVLGQTLPISFTAALFIIHLHLSAPDLVGQKQQHPEQPNRPIASPLIPSILLNALLLAQPPLRSHPNFSFLVLAERVLLTLPHTGLLRLGGAEAKKSAAVSGGFVVAHWAGLRKGVSVWGVCRALVGGGGAVKALGWDAVMGVVVWGVLSWGGGV
ncbi:hypothetical protein C7974DRAFT_412990 [Boeremia exigua]|uniref:uncharacterized protein n=1 Tax=Boeremia exigua TaxID=749465 RepID=UPI001E8E542C|nr:uncharacterized protein C7974DRAFT_412990 [Boeremia exigua]KAH6629171.1 hypothetical protein C7974DRAFT_412990 [Boeremia exigua]